MGGARNTLRKESLGFRSEGAGNTEGKGGVEAMQGVEMCKGERRTGRGCGRRAQGRCGRDTGPEIPGDGAHWVGTGLQPHG